MFVALTATMMTACGGSNDAPERKMTRTATAQRVTVVYNDAPFHQSACDVVFDMDFTRATAKLTFSNITFAPRMPEISFSLEGLRLGYVNDDNVKISSTGTLTPMEGYEVSGVEGTADFKNNILRLKMNIVSRGNTYVTCVCSPTLYTYPQRRVVADDQVEYVEYGSEEIHNILYKDSFSSITDTYFSFDIFQPATNAFFKMYNIKFVEAMPTQPELRAPLAGAQVEPTATGVVYTASSIVPLFRDGSSWIPMASREMTNVRLSVNYVSATYAVEFDCFGIHYTNDGHLYF